MATDRRRTRGDEDEDAVDFSGSAGTGEANATTELSHLTETEKRAWRKELAEREQRRIRPGFWLPGETE